MARSTSSPDLLTINSSSFLRLKSP